MKQYPLFVVFVIIMLPIMAEASVVTKSGCAVKVEKVTDKLLVTEIVAIEQSDTENMLCKSKLDGYGIKKGTEIEINVSNDRAIRTAVGMAESFILPVSYFTGSMGSDGKVYGGPFLYDFHDSYEEAVEPEEPTQTLRMYLTSLIQKIFAIVRGVF